MNTLQIKVSSQTLTQSALLSWILLCPFHCTRLGSHPTSSVIIQGVSSRRDSLLPVDLKDDKGFFLNLSVASPQVNVPGSHHHLQTHSTASLVWASVRVYWPGTFCFTNFWQRNLFLRRVNLYPGGSTVSHLCSSSNRVHRNCKLPQPLLPPLSDLSLLSPIASFIYPYCFLYHSSNLYQYSLICQDLD